MMAAIKPWNTLGRDLSESITPECLEYSRTSYGMYIAIGEEAISAYACSRLSFECAWTSMLACNEQLNFFLRIYMIMMLVVNNSNDS